MNRRILSLLALAVTACTSTTNPASYDDDPTTKTATAITEITANVRPIVMDDGTKASVSTAGKFSWVENDRLGFWPSADDVTFGAPTQCIFFVDKASGSEDTMPFRSNGWGLISGMKYYSYYPYDATASASAVSITYKGQNQSLNDNANHLASYEYLYSSAVASVNVAFDYAHLGSFAKFVLTVDSEYSSCLFTDVVLSSASPVFVESAIYNPCTQDVTLTSKVRKTNFTISLNSGNGFRANGDNKLVIYAMMSPSQWSGVPVTVTAHTTDYQEFIGTFTPSKNQEAGKGYAYSASMACTGGYYDLSKPESANCYMVTEAGDYMFKAVQGNTNTAVNAQRVAVLWESVGTTSAPAVGSVINNVSYENGYVRFSTPQTFRKGNALIAAYDGNNTILWSWHIWCTDEPEDEEYKFDAGFLMDRNLGALERTGNLSAGLYYQWGRKDPFPGTASISGCVQSKTTLGNFPAPVESDSNTGTMSYAIQHPTTLIKGTHQLDWVRNYETADRTWYRADGGKTKHDPCPPGYRVTQGSTTANTTAGRGFWGVAFGINNTVRATNYVCQTPAGSLSFSMANHSLTVPIANGQTAYYPAAGCINDLNGTMEYVGDHAFFWTNIVGGTDHTYSAWNTQYSAVLDVNMSASSGTVTVNWNSGRASGKNVRCQLVSTDTASTSAPNEAFVTEYSNW